MKKLLNVGGNNKAIAIPPQYAEFEHLLLDIDPKGSPDILCDARELMSFEAARFDVVYCDHNLEHYYRHDVPRVLTGFFHVLKDDGFADIRVPDLTEVMRATIAKGLDIEDVLYQSSEGPIMVLDVLYGFSVEIEKSGQDFFSHKTGFTMKSLLNALQKAGFSHPYGSALPEVFEIRALAFKGKPDDAARSMFRLPPE